jgi:radical SAM protein with 4Fe4S-binding SPASM domain
MKQKERIVEDKLIMDGHKLFWHLDRVNEWLKKKRISPLHIDLGITTGCNMACTYCYGVLQGRTGKTKRFDMPKESLIELLKDAKQEGVRSIAFIGEGENTLNEALYDGLDYAKEIDLDVSLATNGVLLKKNKIPDMLRALTWLRFNISAATEETFFKVHRMREFNTVIENIRTCVQQKKQNGLNTTIGMQMVLGFENVNDVVPLAKLSSELGVDYLVIKPCSFDPDKTLIAPTDEYLDMQELLRQAEEYSNENYNVVVKWAKITNKGLKKFRKCFGTRFIINISGDGSVFPCGHFFNIRRDEFIMGNIIKTPFSEVIKSERYWNVQKKIEAVDVNKDCETNCRHYYISDFLWKLKNPPPHKNFI